MQACHKSSVRLQYTEVSISEWKQQICNLMHRTSIRNKKAKSNIVKQDLADGNSEKEETTEIVAKMFEGCN